MGCPGSIYEKTKKIANTTNIPDVDELANAMWTETLDEMIEAFCFIIDEGEPMLGLPYEEYSRENYRRELLIKKGLTAFATYYQSLWD